MFGFDPLTAASLLILAGATPQNAASLCSPSPPAKINIIPKTLDLKYDYSRTLAQIQGQETDTIDPYGFHGMSMTQGFMQGQIKMVPRVKLGQEYLGKYQAICLWYDTVDIVLEIDPMIVIGKEVYADRCMRQAVLDHEMKHVKVDRQIVNKYAKIMGQKVFDGLKERGFKVGPVKAESAQQIATRMQKTVFQIVDHEYQKMALERTDAQRAVDNLQEYERVDALCPDFKDKRAKLMGK